MALIARVSRLFKADMHAVLDQIEEPISLLRQSIREMEDALARQEDRIKRLEHEQRSLQRRAEEQEAAGDELDAKLDLCFANDNEELARKLTRRKLQAARLAGHLRSRLQRVAATLGEQRSAYEENVERLEAMRQKAECLAESGATRPDAELDDELTVHDDEVEVAFLQEKARRKRS